MRRIVALYYIFPVSLVSPYQCESTRQFLLDATADLQRKDPALSVRVFGASLAYSFVYFGLMGIVLVTGSVGGLDPIGSS